MLYTLDLCYDIISKSLPCRALFVADVPLVFPFSAEVEQNIARAVQVVLIPDGATIIDSIKKEVRDICHSISYVMKQRLVPKLDVYVAPSVLEL